MKTPHRQWPKSRMWNLTFLLVETIVYWHSGGSSVDRSAVCGHHGKCTLDCKIFSRTDTPASSLFTPLLILDMLGHCMLRTLISKGVPRIHQLLFRKTWILIWKGNGWCKTFKYTVNKIARTHMKFKKNKKLASKGLGSHSSC